MYNQRYFSARTVISMVTWLIIIVITLIAALILFFLTVLDDKSMLDIHSRVEIAFNIEKDSLYKLNVDYSYWDEGYDSTVANRDDEWIETTYQNYLIPTYGLSYVILIDKNRDVEILAESSEVENKLTPTMVLSSSILERVMMNERRNIVKVNDSFFAKLNGGDFLVSLEPFREESKGNIIDNSFLLLAVELNQSYLVNLSKKFRLPTLYTSNDVKSNDSMPLTGIDSRSPISNLYWYTPKISDDVTGYVILILLSLMAVTVTLARILLSKNYHDRDVYQEKLFIAATTDPLTSIWNRRQFLGAATREIQTHLSNNYSLSFLLLDIDHFKQINDSYGHAVGDEALKHFVDICRKFFRETDIFGRLGGEEFGVILAGIENDKAIEIADELRELVSKSPLKYNDKSIDLTVSIGVSFLTHQSSIEEMLSDADTALYMAKNSGRNRVKHFNRQ